MSTYTPPEFDLSTAAYSDNGTVEHYYTVKTLLREVAKAEQRGAEAMREWCAEVCEAENAAAWSVSGQLAESIRTLK